MPTYDAHFSAVVSALWRAVVTGDAALGDNAFFPEGAYLQIKALGNDAADWKDRLLAHYYLDITAAHDFLGPDASGAHLLGVELGAHRWIAPGACYNKEGYWFTPDARLVYSQSGVTKSFGIAALDSWRGEWYVIHLGSEVPPSDQGVVDSPTTGPGTPGLGGGC